MAAFGLSQPTILLHKGFVDEFLEVVHFAAQGLAGGRGGDCASQLSPDLIFGNSVVPSADLLEPSNGEINIVGLDNLFADCFRASACMEFAL